MGIEKINNIENVLTFKKYDFEGLNNILNNIMDEKPIIVPRFFFNKEHHIAIRGAYNLLKKHKSGENSSEVYIFGKEDVGFNTAAEYINSKQGKSLVLNYVDALNVEYENLKKIKDF